MPTSTSFFQARTAKALVVATMLLAMLLAACAPRIADAGGKPTQDPADSPDQSLASGGLDIAETEVLVMESFPVQVAVFVRGHLRDGCTEIDEILKTFDPATNTFAIEITTVRDADALCTLALVPFEERVELDVYGLEAGTYTVNVNGAIDTFTLDVDNSPSRDDEERVLPAPGVPSDDSVTRGIAELEDLDIFILDSLPAQVAVVARGHLRDGCTEIDEIRQTFKADTNTFFVEITTVRSSDGFCTMALVPFEERVSLAVRGLPAGTYTVDVNGVIDSFTLDGDNAPPADGESDSDSGSGAPSDESMTYDTADIEGIDIRITESDLTQVAVVARGYLGDGCTEIDESRKRFDAAAETFYVEITTVRPTEAICILILQGFEERITLDVEGLAAGTYTVNINGVTDTFTLEG